MQIYKQVMHPEGYHGHPAKSPFFEGWYFKLVDSSGNHRYAVIPGISLSPGGIGPHCFVQILDGSSGETSYHTYPLDTFMAARHKLDIQIGPNTFSAHGVHLDVPDTKLNIKGQIQFSELHPWPVKWHTPGIMGWYAWVPFMECYHGVLSFDHILEGTLEINGQQVDFTDGRGYIEKDWGQSFPSGWVWMQSNHFGVPGTSFTASIAMIPWIGSSFRGFIIGLYHKSTLYRFATYTGAKTDNLEVHKDSVNWVVSDRHHRLEIHAFRAMSGNLRGPSRKDMARRVPETLQATIAVKLTTKSNGRILFEDTGLVGGLEIAGDLETLTRNE